MSRAFSVVLWAATGVALAFLVVPVVAIFVNVPPGELLDALRSDVAQDALRVTLETTLIAQTLILLVGTPAAYLLANARFPGRNVAITLVELPLVLPPAVAGVGLLAAFGRLGLLGDTLSAFGLEIAFTKAAVVMAVVFVAGPFYVRTAIAAFEGVDRTLVDASRTLGKGPGATFARKGQVDEYVVLLHDAPTTAEITAGGEKKSTGGYTVTFVPPGPCGAKRTVSTTSVRPSKSGG